MGGKNPKGPNMKTQGDLYLLEAFKFLKPLFLISINLIIKKGEKNEGNEIYFVGNIAINTTFRLRH